MHSILKVVPKILHSVLSGEEGKNKRQRKETNQFLCQNGENKVIRHLPFTGPCIGTWKLVKRMVGKMDFVSSCDHSLERTNKSHYSVCSLTHSRCFFSKQLYTLQRGTKSISQQAEWKPGVNLSSENKHRDQRYHPSVQICPQLTFGSTRISESLVR